MEKLHKDKILKFFPNLFLGLKTDDIRRFTLFSPFENLTKQEAKNLARRLLSTIYTGIAGTMAISRTNEYFGYNNLIKNNQAVKETGTQRLENRKKLAQELKAK